MASDSFLLDRSLAVFSRVKDAAKFCRAFFEKQEELIRKALFNLVFVCFLDAEDYSPAVDRFLHVERSNRMSLQRVIKKIARKEDWTSALQMLKKIEYIRMFKEKMKTVRFAASLQVSSV